MSRSKIKTLFVLYGAVMLYLLLFGRESWLAGTLDLEQVKLHINLIPFHTVRYLVWAARFRLTEYADSGLVWFAIKNLGGNLLLFIPLGIFLPTIWQRQRRFWVCCGSVAGLICAIEVIQLLTTVGSMDIDDLIFNVAGAAIGYGIWRIITRSKCNP